MLEARQLEQPLTREEQILRDHFVAEYLKDFNAFQAAIRMGFQASFAGHWSQTLWQDGYVQRKIQYLTRRQKIEDEEAKILLENELLRIAQSGSDTARVSAIREFNAMKGWSKTDGAADSTEAIVEALKEFAQQAPA
jgi:hypothetical protein